MKKPVGLGLGLGLGFGFGFGLGLVEEAVSCNSSALTY